MQRPSPPLIIATAAYAAAVILANVLTARYGQVGWFGLSVTAGTYAAGAALLARDFVQRHATTTYGRSRGITYRTRLGYAYTVGTGPARPPRPARRTP